MFRRQQHNVVDDYLSDDHISVIGGGSGDVVDDYLSHGHYISDSRRQRGRGSNMERIGFMVPRKAP